MPQITSIKQQKNKNRINVYLDNKFGFGIDLDNFVLSDLKVGKNISEKEIERIIKIGEFQKILDKVIRFASIRPRSKKEIENYLYRKKVPILIQNDIFIKLKNLGFINDEKFARWWIEIRQEFSPKSKRVLSSELKLKGINKDVIEASLGEVEINERDIALNLLKKRKSHWESVKKEKLKQKMIFYLIGKGFSINIAQNAFKEYNTSTDGKVN